MSGVLKTQWLTDLVLQFPRKPSQARRAQLIWVKVQLVSLERCDSLIGREMQEDGKWCVSDSFNYIPAQFETDKFAAWKE